MKLFLGLSGDLVIADDFVESCSARELYSASKRIPISGGASWLESVQLLLFESREA